VENKRLSGWKQQKTKNIENKHKKKQNLTSEVNAKGKF
jgi:hypothetical protein